MCRKRIMNDAPRFVYNIVPKQSATTYCSSTPKQCGITARQVWAHLLYAYTARENTMRQVRTRASPSAEINPTTPAFTTRNIAIPPPPLLLILNTMC